MLNRILAATLITLTFTLINLGGHVHNTGSSLACPDWPLCFGQVMPVMKGGVLIEHGHRLLGALVGILTFVLLIKLWNTKHRKIALWAFVMVLFQGLLGGLTVIYQLPPLISIAHLSLSMAFFCVLIYIHHKLASSSMQKRPDKLVSVTLTALYLQIVLGAIIRHLGLGLACGAGSENSILCAHPLSLDTFLHMSHRFLGVFAGVLIAGMTLKLMKEGFSIILTVLICLLGIQIWLGIAVISTGIQPLPTMLHLSVATLLLGIVWKIRLKQSLL